MQLLRLLDLGTVDGIGLSTSFISFGYGSCGDLIWKYPLELTLPVNTIFSRKSSAWVRTVAPKNEKTKNGVNLNFTVQTLTSDLQKGSSKIRQWARPLLISANFHSANFLRQFVSSREGSLEMPGTHYSAIACTDPATAESAKKILPLVKGIAPLLPPGITNQ